MTINGSEGSVPPLQTESPAGVLDSIRVSPSEPVGLEDLFFGPVGSLEPPFQLRPAGSEVIDIHQTRTEKVDLDLRTMEDRLLERAVDIVDGAMRFADLSPMDLDPEAGANPPAEWVAELGEARAFRLFTAAKAGWQSAKDAPVGIKVAEGVAKSIIKARSMERAAPTTLNVAYIQKVEHHYNTVEIDDGT